MNQDLAKKGDSKTACAYIYQRYTCVIYISLLPLPVSEMILQCRHIQSLPTITIEDELWKTQGDPIGETITPPKVVFHEEKKKLHKKCKNFSKESWWWK